MANATPTIESTIASGRLTQAAQFPITKLHARKVKWDGVTVLHYRVAPGELPEHLHRMHNVFVPLAGAVTIRGPVTSGSVAARRRVPGEISVTPAGVRYAAQWENELDYLSVSFTEAFLDRMTCDFTANQNARIVLACGPKDELVRSLARSLAHELDDEMPTGRLYLESLVNTLVVHLLRHYSTESLIADLQFGGLPPHKLRRATEFIEAHLDRDLTLTEIAEAVELSQYHFARAFKQTTQRTPIQFLMERRVETAKQLLRETDLPLVEISLRSGFKTQSHFSTLFRKQTGCTPKAFRADG